MELRIDDLKNGKTEKVNTLEIKIMKKVSDEKYIAADETAHTLLVLDQSRKGGSAYNLIKPSYEDDDVLKKTKYTYLHDNNWSEIFSYLDLKSIYNLEIATIYFKDVFRRTDFGIEKSE